MINTGGTRGEAWVACLVAALASALALSAPASAAPGDVYAVDRSADAVWKFGPSGGEATPLAQGAPPFQGSPDGITLGPDGFLYVADEIGKVFRVDRNTGDVTEVADLGSGVANPIDVAFDPRGRLLALDYNSSDISVVNLSTGALTPFYDGPSTSNFNSLAIKRDGTIFLGDEGDNKVWRLTGGTLTPIIDDPAFDGPDGVLLSPDERFLYVGTFEQPNFGRYDLRTGQLDVFGLPGAEPWSLALLPSNTLIYSNQIDGDLETVPVGGGAQGTFSDDPDLDTPREITVEPAPCAGRIPTVVGTTARDVIRGSRFADVISTLGGRDVIRGLAGRDIICGGAGGDRLIGGKGRDRLIGGKGKDRLIGGKGRDRLFGGKGRDALLGGPGNDACRGGPGPETRRSC